jgi:hypothetical protein
MKFKVNDAVTHEGRSAQVTGVTIGKDDEEYATIMYGNGAFRTLFVGEIEHRKKLRVGDTVHIKSCGAEIVRLLGDDRVEVKIQNNVVIYNVSDLDLGPPEKNTHPNRISPRKTKEQIEAWRGAISAIDRQIVLLATQIAGYVRQKDTHLHSIAEAEAKLHEHE